MTASSPNPVYSSWRCRSSAIRRFFTHNMTTLADSHQATTRRPRSLAEVVLWGEELGDMDSFLREFLDEFYGAQTRAERTAMLAEAPPLSAEAHRNAYLAAVAEHLAWRYELAVPAWPGQPSRFLKRAYFPCGLESLKATLLVESPTAFRRRLIFVGADPLYRPRRDTAGIGH